jgi:protein-S-isoprenylcysteine O-methyltransferase Ste14
MSKVNWFIIFRTFVYASLFVGIFLIYVPANLLSGAGITQPNSIGPLQVLGMILISGGGALALWCIFAFVDLGAGTPAPFDPPRKLVFRGPYRFLRNPMYLGAGTALLGAAIFYSSWLLLAYTAMFFISTHLFVVKVEEPALRKSFGHQYERYCRQVNRWLPKYNHLEQE